VGLCDPGKVQEGQVQGPASGSDNSWCQYRLRNKGIESSPAKKDLGVQVNEKLNMTWQCALKGQLYPGLRQTQRGQQVEGADSAPLLRSGETPPGVLPPALEPSAQERHGSVRAGPKEGHQNVQRAGTPLL